ncbi:MAG: hypothetical protein OXU61_00845 [Gammaproteobacteria bacterium]|nr:hypothetical protein [Gammaproteobacteria bacterium]
MPRAGLGGRKSPLSRAPPREALPRNSHPIAPPLEGRRFRENRSGDGGVLRAGRCSRRASR